MDAKGKKKKKRKSVESIGIDPKFVRGFFVLCVSSRVHLPAFFSTFPPVMWLSMYWSSQLKINPYWLVTLYAGFSARQTWGVFNMNSQLSQFLYSDTPTPKFSDQPHVVYSTPGLGHIVQDYVLYVPIRTYESNVKEVEKNLIRAQKVATIMICLWLIDQ